MLAIAAVSLASVAQAEPVPSAVAASARAIARSGARPARLTTPMRGVRQEAFAGTQIWIVDSGRMDDSSLCGTGGCDVQFWRRGADGHLAKIFDRRVLAYTIAGAETAQPLVRVEHHGSRCGGPGNAECTAAYRWNADTARLVVEPAGGGGGVLAGPLPAAVAPDRRRIPPTVVAALDDLDRQCRAQGGRSAAKADELPDLDGDGHPEWAVSGQSFFCSKGKRVIENACAGKPCPVTIFATAGGPVHPAYRAVGTAYLISYEPGRTRLLVAPPGETPVTAIKTARPLIFAADGSAKVAP